MNSDEANQRLFAAALSGNVDSARAAIEAGADVNARDFYQNTPLYWAARNNNAAAVRLLIERGADGSARNVDRVTPRDWAASPEVVEAMETGAQSKGPHARRVRKNSDAPPGRDIGNRPPSLIFPPPSTAPR